MDLTHRLQNFFPSETKYTNCYLVIEYTLSYKYNIQRNNTIFIVKSNTCVEKGDVEFSMYSCDVLVEKIIIIFFFWK